MTDNDDERAGHLASPKLSKKEAQRRDQLVVEIAHHVRMTKRSLRAYARRVDEFIAGGDLEAVQLAGQEEQQFRDDLDRAFAKLNEMLLLVPGYDGNPIEQLYDEFDEIKDRLAPAIVAAKKRLAAAPNNGGAIAPAASGGPGAPGAGAAVAAGGGAGALVAGGRAGALRGNAPNAGGTAAGDHGGGAAAPGTGRGNVPGTSGAAAGGLGGSAAVPGASQPAVAPPTRPRHKPDHALKPDQLQADATFSHFRVWRDAWTTYYAANDMAQLSPDNQEAYLLSCISTEMRERLRF